MSREQQRWATRVGVILAVAGSAVGLGNFLRFPGNAAQNGGGAFMIPYFISLIVLGIPIGWAEWAMGRHGGRKGFHSAPAILGVWGRGSGARYLGAFGVLVPMVVYFYYVVIESWCLGYAWSYVTGGVGITPGTAPAQQVAQSRAFFESLTGSGFDGFMLDGSLHASVVFWGVTTVLNLYFIHRGLSRGIETFCRWAMPLMAVCAGIILVRVLTLGTPDPALPEQSVWNGLGFLWNPRFESLGNFQTWLAAAGQIFFSLSVGFGVIINYASYMRRDDDVVLSGLTASATNEFFEVALGGLITVTAAVVFLGPVLTGASTGSSFSLGFHTLPVVFAHMPWGNFFGAVFFFMLFLAAITSSLSMLQPTLAFFQEALGLERRPATLLLSAVAVAGNLFVLWFSQGLAALDTLDFWVGSFMIFVVAGTQLICFAWITGVDRGIQELRRGALIPVPKIFRFVIRYVSPAYLLVIFVGFCYANVPGYVRTILGDPTSGIPPNRGALMAWGVIVASMAGLLILTAVGTRRWRAAGLDLDGRQPGPPEDESAAPAAAGSRP